MSREPGRLSRMALEAGFSPDEVIWMLDLPEPLSPYAEVDGEILGTLVESEIKRPT